MSAYSEGYEAFHKGVDRSLNPWGEGLNEWRDWFDGWDTALSCSNR